MAPRAGDEGAIEPLEQQRARVANAGETLAPDKVVESGELETEVLRAAEEIAAKPPQAMQIARSLMRMRAEPVADRIAREAKHFAERLTSSEAREAVMAFLSRKK